MLLTGCASSDYYNSKKYKINQRKKESIEMMELTHMVRKKCSKHKNRPSKPHRKRFYS